MPHVEVRSTQDGYIYRVSSSIPEVIAAWLIETLDRIKPQQHVPAQVSFTPIWNGYPQGAPDWSTNSVLIQDRFLIGGPGAAGLKELAGALTNYAERYEREQAEAEREDEPITDLLT